MQEIIQKLKAAGLKITPQRLAVLEAVKSFDGYHPTAEDVYKKVKEKYPAISLSTVYRVLDKLVEIGEIKEIVVSSSERRYDSRKGAHYHFVCKNCKRIFDVSPDMVKIIWEKPLEGKKILNQNFVVVGLCENCYLE